jgi:hypothetical protein
VDPPLPAAGGDPEQTPIRVKDMQKLSPAWNWSEQAFPDLEAYLIKFAKGHKLGLGSVGAALENPIYPTESAPNPL